MSMPVICYASIEECNCGEPWVHEMADKYQIQEWLDWLEEK